ncbi:MAG: septum formation protein Maf [Flavobacteriaceae bacterium]|nr:MAG: septum formation protein Maf [Flavobacteriaceae bacterium]
MLNEQLATKNIILASGSPRRQQFLRDLEIDFTIQLKPVEEIYDPALKEAEITDFLAKLKAAPFQGTLNDQDVLVTSDTIVWSEGEALGKPTDAQNAYDIIKSLSGKTHSVISSVCLTSTKKQHVFSDVTLVSIKELSDEEIHYYIKNFNPFDKAGAYGIQEWFGYIAVEKIEGSFFNVMGFPIHKFYKEILEF